MSSFEEEFDVVLRELLAVTPELQPLVDEHLKDNHEVLPYILLTRIADRYLKLCRASMSKPFVVEKLPAKLAHVLHILEDAHAQGEDMRTLVALSFVEELYNHGMVSERVYDILPPRLRAEWDLC